MFSNKITKNTRESRRNNTRKWLEQKHINTTTNSQRNRLNTGLYIHSTKLGNKTQVQLISRQSHWREKKKGGKCKVGHDARGKEYKIKQEITHLNPKP